MYAFLHVCQFRYVPWDGLQIRPPLQCNKESTSISSIDDQDT